MKIRDVLREEGTAATETLLILVPLMMLVSLVLFSGNLLIREQMARQDAHSQVFNKAYSMLLYPSPTAPVGSSNLGAHLGGALTAAGRRHAMTGSPFAIPSGVNDAFPGVPGKVSSWSPVNLSASTAEKIQMVDGLPNTWFEGWGYQTYNDTFMSNTTLHMPRYATALRSPWTKLGYPILVSQDAFFEPHQLQTWGDTLINGTDDAPGVNQEVRNKLLLAE
jgi:hypothetical protein